MNKISFVLSNTVQTIDFDSSNYEPTTTLLSFLRQSGKKGAKEGCNEGDCGACTVVLIEKHGSEFIYRAVNSCTVFLASVHGKQVLTIEDLGTPDNLHPVETSFVTYHASQCGFCTPGFIMSLFAQKASKINSNAEELVEAVEGNLCRCTGYNSILNAANEIAQMSDTHVFSKFLRADLLEKINSNKSIHLHKNGITYHIPFTLNDALNLKKQHPGAVVTSGSTDLVLRVTKRKEIIPEIIDISFIQELQGIKENDDTLLIMAGTKIEDLYQHTKDKMPVFANILSRFGSKQIRNRASIGGNVGTASPIGDTLPLLLAYEAQLELISTNGKRKISINNFIKGYRQTDLQKDELIYKIIIPKTDKIYWSHKISKRSHLDISTVSSAFSLKLSDQNTIENIILAFGGMAAMPKRATQTEQFLTGKQWSEQTIYQAAEMLKNEFQPIDDARSSAEARKIFAKNLLIKFFNETKN